MILFHPNESNGWLASLDPPFLLARAIETYSLWMVPSNDTEDKIVSLVNAKRDESKLHTHKL
jgi:hypothetical protein